MKLFECQIVVLIERPLITVMGGDCSAYEFRSRVGRRG